jgi:hypothetical protein
VRKGKALVIAAALPVVAKPVFGEAAVARTQPDIRWECISEGRRLDGHYECRSDRTAGKVFESLEERPEGSWPEVRENRVWEDPSRPCWRLKTWWRWCQERAISVDERGDLGVCYGWGDQTNRRNNHYRCFVTLPGSSDRTQSDYRNGALDQIGQQH